jgi:NADH-quinone oxidoreductase subunit C
MPLAILFAQLQQELTSKGCDFIQTLGEVTCHVPAIHYLSVAQTLKQNPHFGFDQLIDLCGVDYSQYHGRSETDLRFGVVVHLLSIHHNWRLRLQVLCPSDENPVLPTLVDVWDSANWFEREAFDLFGILFEKHPDLRRILTDYSFIGHPLRKDFPLSGHVEMRYDPEKKNVIYEPVTIEPRELVPRTVR